MSEKSRFHCQRGQEIIFSSPESNLIYRLIQRVRRTVSSGGRKGGRRVDVTTHIISFQNLKCVEVKLHTQKRLRVLYGKELRFGHWPPYRLISPMPTVLSLALLKDGRRSISTPSTIDPFQVISNSHQSRPLNFRV